MFTGAVTAVVHINMDVS